MEMIKLAQAVRPRHTRFKTFEEVAIAVDEMFSVAFQNAGSESVVPLTGPRCLSK